jgi:hypothetical protein
LGDKAKVFTKYELYRYIVSTAVGDAHIGIIGSQ